MRLGISAVFPHSSPEEWAKKHREAGLSCVVFPLKWNADTAKIDAYADAAREYDLLIAEVGAWCNPLDPDPIKRRENREYVTRQLELAEYVGARCCVNIAGAAGEVWDGSYAANYAPGTMADIVAFLREILDRVKPVRTRYALEPMPHMLPDSPESCLDILRAVDRPGLAVHVDIVNMLASPRLVYGNAELIARTFTQLGPHIRSCHLKDAVIDHSLTVSIREVEPGTGVVDIPAYIRAADALDPDMPMIIEHLKDIPAYERAIGYVSSITE